MILYVVCTDTASGEEPEREPPVGRSIDLQAAPFFVMLQERTFWPDQLTVMLVAPPVLARTRLGEAEIVACGVMTVTVVLTAGAGP